MGAGAKLAKQQLVDKQEASRRLAYLAAQEGACLTLAGRVPQPAWSQGAAGSPTGPPFLPLQPPGWTV